MEKATVWDILPLLGGIWGYPVGSLHGQVWLHCHWPANSSSTNQTVRSWLESLCGMLQCTASSRWTPSERQGTFLDHFKNVLLDEMSLIYWLLCSHLSLAVAWSSAIPFKVQWCKLQWVQLCQHFHCSHIQSCSLCWTNSRETKIPEYTTLGNAKSVQCY